MFCVDSYEQVLNESFSRGNQLKFYNNGYWIKLDTYGCSEGLAEELTSLLESCIQNFSHVSYKADVFEYNGVVYKGCYSYNMYGRLDVNFVSLRHLLRANDIPLNIFIKYSDIKDNIKNVVSTILSLTGLNIFDYLVRLIFLDALIINEDRHLMNLGVCYCASDNRFYEAPCFDNGSSLFCMNWTYRKRKSLQDNLKSAQSVARPFSKFFDKQLEAFLDLGARPLQIVRKVDTAISNYDSGIYDVDKVFLAKEVLSNRMSYYNGRVFVYV